MTRKRTYTYTVMFRDAQLAYFETKEAAFEYLDAIYAASVSTLDAMEKNGRAPSQCAPVFYVLEWDGETPVHRMSRL